MKNEAAKTEQKVDIKVTAADTEAAAKLKVQRDHEVAAELSAEAEDLTEKSQVTLARPCVAELMQLLGEAGI